jgi:DNA-binding MarR family transcriptional regulator
MPETQPPTSAQLGQAVGEAARTLGRLQAGVLASVGTSFEAWVTLNTIATRRPSLDADPIPLDAATLRSELARGTQRAESAVEDLLGQLESDELISREKGEVTLTAGGRELHEKVRSGSAAVTTRLLDGIDPGLVDETVLGLREITRRAEGLLDG